MYPIIGIRLLMDMGRFLAVLLICRQLSSGLLLQYKKSALTSIMLIHQKEFWGHCHFHRILRDFPLPMMAELPFLPIQTAAITIQYQNRYPPTIISLLVVASCPNPSTPWHFQFKQTPQNFMISMILSFQMFLNQWSVVLSPDPMVTNATCVSGFFHRDRLGVPEMEICQSQEFFHVVMSFMLIAWTKQHQKHKKGTLRVPFVVLNLNPKALLINGFHQR